MGLQPKRQQHRGLQLRGQQHRGLQPRRQRQCHVMQLSRRQLKRQGANKGGCLGGKEGEEDFCLEVAVRCKRPIFLGVLLC